MKFDQLLDEKRNYKNTQNQCLLKMKTCAKMHWQKNQLDNIQKKKINFYIKLYRNNLKNREFDKEPP